MKTFYRITLDALLCLPALGVYALSYVNHKTQNDTTVLNTIVKLFPVTRHPLETILKGFSFSFGITAIKTWPSKTLSGEDMDYSESSPPQEHECSLIFPIIAFNQIVRIMLHSTNHKETTNYWLTSRKKQSKCPLDLELETWSSAHMATHTINSRYNTTSPLDSSIYSKINQHRLVKFITLSRPFWRM